MKKILMALVILLSTAAMVAQKTTASNNKENWQKIGEATVDLQSEQETVITTNADNFKAIKLQSGTTPIYLQSFDVVFSNGEKQVVNYGGFEPVQLKGNGRYKVTQVVIRCSSLDDRDKKANMAVMGLKANTTFKSNKVLVSR